MTSGQDPSREAAPAAFPGGSPPANAIDPLPFGLGAAADAQAADAFAAAQEAEPQRSLAEDLRDLAGDAQTFLEAEKAYEGARLSYALSRGKGVALSFVVAGVLGYFALVAAVVGLLLALAPLITAWGALAAVPLSLALLAFLFLQSGIKRLRRMRTLLGGGAAGSADGAAS